MSNNVIVTRRLLKVEDVIGENTAQHMIIGEIRLPHKVEKVSDVDAQVKDCQTEIVRDKVIVKGVLHKQVFYVEEGTGRVFEESFDESFTGFVDIPGAREGMNVQCKAKVEYVNHEKVRVIGHPPNVSTVFKQTAVIALFVKVTEMKQIEVVTDVQGAVTRKELLKVDSVVGENTKQVNVSSEITIPKRVKKISDVDAEVRDIRTEIVPDKVIVSGLIHKQVYYVEEPTGLVFEESIDETFTQFVDVPGARPDMNVFVDADIEHISHEKVRERGMPPHVATVFRQTVIVKLFVKVTEHMQINVVVDVPGLPVVKDLLKVAQVIGEGTSQLNLENEICIPKPVKKIKDVDTKVNNITTEVVPNKVIVRGVLHKQIFYVEEGTGEVFEISVDEPFTHFVDVPGAEKDMNVQVNVRVEYVNHEKIQTNDDETVFRQTAVLEVFAKVTETRQLQVVVSVGGIVPPDEICPPGQIIQYTIMAGDTFYLLAQRFGTTVEAIQAANPGVNPLNLQIGQVINIPCGIPGARG